MMAPGTYDCVSRSDIHLLPTPIKSTSQHEGLIPKSSEHQHPLESLHHNVLDKAFRPACSLGPLFLDDGAEKCNSQDWP